MKATGHGTTAKALAAHDKYGLNAFEVPVPPFLKLLRGHLVAPFFCFQLFNCMFDRLESRQEGGQQSPFRLSPAFHPYALPSVNFFNEDEES
eukprot:1158718-Pelagomonas_calceolata.AAC.3